MGGVGAVTYSDDGTATVKITDKQGKVHTVTIEGDGGQTFSCPDGTQAKFEPIDIRAGRVKITLQQVHKKMDTLEKRYPEHRAPAAAVRRYNGLLTREHPLVKAYNDAVDEHNAILTSDCDPA